MPGTHLGMPDTRTPPRYTTYPPWPAHRAGQLPVLGIPGIDAPAVGPDFGDGPWLVNQEVWWNSVQEDGEWLGLRIDRCGQADPQPRVPVQRYPGSILTGDEDSDTGFMGTSDSQWPD